MEKGSKKRSHVDDLPQEAYRHPKVRESQWGTAQFLLFLGFFGLGTWILLGPALAYATMQDGGYGLVILVFFFFLFFGHFLGTSGKKGSRFIEVLRSWTEEVRLRKRPGCAVFLHLKVTAPIAGRTLEIAVQFKNENGSLHKSVLRAYRGQLEEVLVRKEVELPKVKDEMYPFVETGTFVPLRAFIPDECPRDLRIKPVVTLKIEGKILDVVILPYEVFDTKSILAAIDVKPEDGVLIENIEMERKGEEVLCQVCGYGMTDDVITCTLCDTPHHQECWDYVGGCSTYGCEGRPELSENEESAGNSQ